MLREKVAQSELNGKSSMLEKYDHYVAVDWSMRIMAIAHMTRDPFGTICAKSASSE